MGDLSRSASRGYRMPQSIPVGLTRTHVLQALADLDAGLDHPFGQPTGYELLHEGKRYTPKAVGTPWVESCCPRNSAAVRLLDKPTSCSESWDSRSFGRAKVRPSRIPMPPVTGRIRRFGSSWRITSPCSKPSCRVSHTRSLSTARL